MEIMENKERSLPDFLIIPSVIVLDKKLQPLDGYVYGVIYWYTKLRLEKCIASSKSIADVLSSTEGGVQNAINRLTKRKYINSTYDRATHVRELIPMVSFNRIDDASLISTKSNDVVAPHQMMRGTTSNDVHNNNTIKRTVNKNIQAEPVALKKGGKVDNYVDNSHKGIERIGSIVQRFKPPEPKKTNGGASYEWQVRAVDVWNLLGINGKPTSAWFKEWKLNRQLCERAYTFMADAGKKDDPERYFYWCIQKFRKERHAKQIPVANVG